MTPLEHSLALCSQAEAAALDVLAQTDPYGRGPLDIARWEELLDHVASLHARVLLLRARLDQQRAAFYRTVRPLP